MRFGRTCTNPNTCFPSYKGSWLCINCMCDVITLFTLLPSQPRGPGLVIDDALEGNALGLCSAQPRILPERHVSARG